MIIQRTILRTIEKRLFPGGDRQPVVIILGPRQAGKTTLAKQLLERNMEKAEYFNCDFLDVRERFSYERSSDLQGALRGKRLIILDEAQRIENIGLVLKIIVDAFPEVQVIATGSSSLDLSNKIVEPLTGRKWEYHLFPLSYEEYVGGEQDIERRRRMERMVRYGGYPALHDMGNEDVERRLREISGSYLFKDLLAFQDVRKPEVLQRLVKLLAFQIGSEVSYEELARQLKIDHSVVQHYIQLLEETFVVFRLGAFRRNLRSEVVRSRKVYFWDLGIRNAIVNNFLSLQDRADGGALWENFIVAERLKMNWNHERFPATYFWRSYAQQEIDYLEEENGKLLVLECKLREQRWKPSKAFREAYPQHEAHLVYPGNADDFLLST